MKRKDYISFGKSNNFFLFGGGIFLLQALIFLKKNKKNILVITSRRHYDAKFSKILKKNKIKHLVLKSLNNKKLENILKKIGKDKIGISLNAEWIFQKKQIKIFRNKLINVHGSLLPSFRGGGGISWPLMMRNFLSGTTAHLIDEKIDTGKIILQKRFIYPKKIQSSLMNMTSYANKKHSKLVGLVLKRLVQNKGFYTKLINKNNSNYFPRLKTNIHGWINWDWKVQDIHSFIKAFSEPYNGASTYINRTKRVVGDVIDKYHPHENQAVINRTKIRILKTSFKKINIKSHPFQYGLIFLIKKGNPHILCDNGILQVKLAKTEYGEIFKNFKIGDRLYTPYQKLDFAKNIRVKFKT